MNLECDYAVRIVYVIAKAKDRIDAKTISERSCVSLRFALKILRKLVMGGIVVSFMGTNGGYKLAKSPEDISIYDVIYAINGEYYFNRCVDSDYICSRMGNSRCQFNKIFESITQDTIKILKSYTFDSFLESTPSTDE
jgi:Rrf2 family protein